MLLFNRDRGVALAIGILHFNTSNVTIQLYTPTPDIAINNFNTSNVTIQRASAGDPFWEKAFQYI